MVVVLATLICAGAAAPAVLAQTPGKEKLAAMGKQKVAALLLKRDPGQCSSSHPYLLEKSYAPDGTSLPVGVGALGLGDIGMLITGIKWSKGIPSVFDGYAIGTKTGSPSSQLGVRHALLPGAAPLHQRREQRTERLRVIKRGLQLT